MRQFAAPHRTAAPLTSRDRSPKGEFMPSHLLEVVAHGRGALEERYHLALGADDAKPEHHAYLRRFGRALDGVVLSGAGAFFGEGQVTGHGEHERWIFSSSSRNAHGDAFFNFVFFPRRGGGAFVLADQHRAGGGPFGGVLFQEKPQANPNPCGKLLWEHYYESSDENGQHIVRYHWWHYENCDDIQFVDTKGSDDPKNFVTLGPVRRLKRDGKKAPFVKPPVTITPLSTPLNGDEIGPGEKRAGQLRLFYIAGCAKPRVVQFVKNSRTFKAPAANAAATMPKDTSGAWQQDGADPYSGQMPDGEGQNAVEDIPGQDVAGLANDPDVKGCPDGTVVTLTWEFETFFFCDGKLLTWASWSMTLTFTVASGVPTPGAPTVGDPEFHDPSEKPQSPGPK
jgi:hypothetical protein